MDALFYVIEWTLAIVVGMPAAIIGVFVAVCVAMLAVGVCGAVAISPLYFGCITLEKWNERNHHV